MNRNELFERRKHKRVRFEASAKHREVRTDDFINENRNLSMSSAADISKGGMQILTDAAWLETGDRLVEIELTVSGRVVRLIAHVVWFMYDAKIKRYRSGVEFIMIKNGDLEAISNMV